MDRPLLRVRAGHVDGQTARGRRRGDPQDCPAVLPPNYLAFLGQNSGEVQSCQGGPGSNSWYGNGQADALKAVTAASGNGG